MSVHFRKLALIGIGLIGSSIALAARRQGLAEVISIATRKQETLDEARELGLGDIYTLDATEAVRGADLVILCTPVGAYESVMKAIGPALEPGTIFIGGIAGGQLHKPLSSCFERIVVKRIVIHGGGGRNAELLWRYIAVRNSRTRRVVRQSRHGAVLPVVTARRRGARWEPAHPA